MDSIISLATTVVATLTPHLPRLLEIAKAGGTKILEGAAGAAGEDAWNKAQALWAALWSRKGDGASLESTATLVANDPQQRPQFREALAQVVFDMIRTDDNLAQQIESILRVPGEQEVIARKNSSLKDIDQDLQGEGIQRVIAENRSKGERIRQKKS